VMIAVVYSVKNLSQSAKEHLTASFKGGIEAGVWGADAAANYDKFKKEASSAANLNLNVYAMGGPGITVLKGLVSNANDIAIIKQTIEDYTGKLTADYAVPVDYLTGPMMSFMTGKGDFDLALYNKAIADLYLAKENYIAKRNRLKSINDNADDYNLSEPQLQVIQQHYDGISKGYSSLRRCCRALSKRVPRSARRSCPRSKDQLRRCRACASRSSAPRCFAHFAVAPSTRAVSASAGD
jgi:hypothetical protein